MGNKLTIGSIKHSFFNNSVSKKNLLFNHSSFDFDQLKNEYGILYQLFSSQDELFKNPEVMSYLYYLNNLMSFYYQCDYVREDVKKLVAQRLMIERFISQKYDEEVQKLIYKTPASLKETNRANSSNLPNMSVFRKYVGLTNSKRSYWGYSRALANHSILFLQTICTSVSQEFINLLEQSRQPLIILGIGLYLLRFLIHFLMMMKHIIYAAVSEDLSIKKVLKQEMDKRFFTMASDLVWGLVNLLTNYNIIFQIPHVVVSPLITSILFFDIVLFLAQWSTESAKFLQHQEEFIRQKKMAKGLELDLINKQMVVLNDKWDVESAYYKINILAAALIIIGFGVSLLCSGPLILASLALLSSLGNALYNTTDEFKKYQQTSIALEREKSKGHTNDIHQLMIDNLNEEYRAACFDFWKSLALTTVGTAFIITVAAFSWPVALCLIFGYIAYRFNSHFQKEQGNNLKLVDQENYPSLCMA